MSYYFLHTNHSQKSNFSEISERISQFIFADSEFYPKDHTFVFATTDPIVIKNGFFHPRPYSASLIDGEAEGDIQSDHIQFLNYIVPLNIKKETYLFNGEHKESLVLHFSPETIISELENLYNNTVPTYRKERNGLEKTLVIEISSQYLQTLHNLYKNFHEHYLKNDNQEKFSQYLFEQGIINKEQMALSDEKPFTLRLLKTLFLKHFSTHDYYQNSNMFFPLKIASHYTELQFLDIASKPEYRQSSINFFNKFLIKHLYLHSASDDLISFSNFYFMVDFHTSINEKNNHFSKIFTDTLKEQGVSDKDIEQYLLKFFTKTPQFNCSDINQQRFINYLLEFKEYNNKKFLSHTQKFFSQKSDGNVLFNQIFDSIFTQEEKELYKDTYSSLFPSFYQDTFSFSDFITEPAYTSKKIKFSLLNLYKSLPMEMDYSSFVSMFSHTLKICYKSLDIDAYFSEKYVSKKNSKAKQVSDIDIIIILDESNANSIYGQVDFCKFLIKEIYSNLSSMEDEDMFYFGKPTDKLNNMIRDITLSYQLKVSEKDNGSSHKKTKI